MVTITDYRVATNTLGEQFIALELSGDLEMVQSKQTGNFYATARKCSITSTFNEAVAGQMVGKQLPGHIEKQECEPYEYTNKQTGELITLTHTYNYNPNEKSEAVGAQVLNQVFSQNGVGVLD